jgi:hypothetical protein
MMRKGRWSFGEAPRPWETAQYLAAKAALNRTPARSTPALTHDGNTVTAHVTTCAPAAGVTPVPASTPGASPGTPGAAAAAQRVALSPFTVTTTSTGAALVKVSGNVYYVLAMSDHQVLVGRVIHAVDMPRASLLLMPRALVKLGCKTLKTMTSPAPSCSYCATGVVSAHSSSHSSSEKSWLTVHCQAAEFHRESGCVESVQRVCGGPLDGYVLNDAMVAFMRRHVLKSVAPGTRGAVFSVKHDLVDRVGTAADDVEISRMTCMTLDKYGTRVPKDMADLSAYVSDCMTRVRFRHGERKNQLRGVTALRKHVHALMESERDEDLRDEVALVRLVTGAKPRQNPEGATPAFVLCNAQHRRLHWGAHALQVCRCGLFAPGGKPLPRDVARRVCPTPKALRLRAVTQRVAAKRASTRATATEFRESRPKRACSDMLPSGMPAVPASVVVQVKRQRAVKRSQAAKRRINDIPGPLARPQVVLACNLRCPAPVLFLRRCRCTERIKTLTLSSGH